MTIEVSICNKDDHKSIKVERIEYDKERGHATHYFNCCLKPHESATFAIHLLRDLRISEEKP